MAANYAYIGKNITSPDDYAKATGKARYTDDIEMPRMLVGAILRSPLPHARIVHVDTSRAAKLPGVKAVICGRDTKGVKYGVFSTSKDQQALPVDKVRYIGDEVAAVAAVDHDVALEALDLIRVEYEPLAAVFDPQAAMAEGAALLHDHALRNIAQQVVIEHGDVEAGFKQADYVREDTFQSQNIAHAQMEPYVAMAYVDGSSGKVCVYTPNQSPFTKRRALATTLGVPDDKVRVMSSYIGGAFGGRSEMFPLDFCAAFLASKTGRPVKITYTREESIICTRQKHPFSLVLKTGMLRDGTIVAKHLQAVLDGGAYSSTGGFAVSLPAFFSIAYQKFPNFKYEGIRVYTNKSVRGAMRGHTGQQTVFAHEVQMEAIARDLGLDPVEILLKNAIRTGDSLLNGTKITSCGLEESVRRAAVAINWASKRQHTGEKEAPVKRGVGIAAAGMLCAVGVGIRSSSGAFVRFNERGEVTLITGAQDNGQGNHGMLVQIAAEELGIPPAKITIIAADSELCPQDPGTYLMNTTYTSGNAVRLAAIDAKQQLLEVAAARLEARLDDLEIKAERIYVKGNPEKGLPLREVVWEAFETRGQILGRGSYMPNVDTMNWVYGQVHGQIAGSISFGAVTAEVEVNETTGKVRVLRVAAAHDCGFALNPMRVEGEIEGSVHMGVGHVLTEELVWDGGQCLNANLLDYKLATALDMPQVDNIIVESMDPDGPYGAKEAPETVNIAAVPAIVNAIHDAVGVWITDLPVTPAKVLQALAKQRQLNNQKELR